MLNLNNIGPYLKSSNVLCNTWLTNCRYYETNGLNIAVGESSSTTGAKVLGNTGTALM